MSQSSSRFWGATKGSITTHDASMTSAMSTRAALSQGLLETATRTYLGRLDRDFKLVGRDGRPDFNGHGESSLLLYLFFRVGTHI